MNIAFAIVFIGMMVFLSHLFHAFFRRTMVPDVLLLFIVGIIVGPTYNFISTEHFGAIGQVFTTVTLVFILFEGGMGLCVQSIKSSWKGTLSVSGLGFFTTMIAVGLVLMLFTPLGFMASFMLGAVIGGTSSIVVIPILENLRMTKPSKSILILESAFTDILCIVFALAFLEALRFGAFNPAAIIGKIFSTFIVGGLLGIGGALGWSILLNKVRTIKNSLFMTPAFVFILYGISELLGYSGAITSLTFGFTLANLNLFSFKLIDKYMIHKRITLNEQEKAFQSEIVFLLKTFFFIFMGISIQFSNIFAIMTGLLLTVLLFLLRIFVIKLGVSNSTPREDVVYMAGIVPKGLAAAVLASIPLSYGINNGEFIQNVVFSVILFSILFTSLLIFSKGRFHKLDMFYNLMFRNFPVTVTEVLTPNPTVEIIEEEDSD